MINVTELRNGTVFVDENQIFQVLNYEHIKTGRGSGNIKVKVKNLKSGSITERSFITGARVDEANVEKRKAQYLYQDGENYYFMDPLSFDQFPLSEDILGSMVKFLKEGLEATLLVLDDQALTVDLPNFIFYTIAETGPEEKGNTVSNVYKEAILDNGMSVKVPMFMKVGEKIKVDTRSGEYVERVK